MSQKMMNKMNGKMSEVNLGNPMICYPLNSNELMNEKMSQKMMNKMNGKMMNGKMSHKMNGKMSKKNKRK